MKPKTFSAKDIRRLASEEHAHTYIPSSVYRLQFNKFFTFKEAMKALPYLKALGIDAIYASPYFQAAPGSMHGYDVTDPGRINPELGSPADYERFCGELRSLGLGQILDLVSNHMGIAGNQNAWWTHVLENGPSSIYAHFFDIDWEPEKRDLKDKILIPILGGPYGTVLEKQEIQLEFAGGAFSILYGPNRLPVSPVTYPMILAHRIENLARSLSRHPKDLKAYQDVLKAFRDLPDNTAHNTDRKQKKHIDKERAKKRLDQLARKSEPIRKHIRSRLLIFNGRAHDPDSFNLMHELLDAQPYRMAHWRVASEEINYRRFFDVNDLVAIRPEDPDVFDHYHRYAVELILEGKVHGLRIDHPDGLYDPTEYFHDLQVAVLFEKLSKRLKSRYPEAFTRPEEASRFRQVLKRTLRGKSFRAFRPLYVVVEKILDRKEDLSQDWMVHGTVGYDFLNALTAVFVDQQSAKAFDDTYKEFTGRETDYGDLTYQKKKFFALVHMASEINTLGHRLDRISERDRLHRDHTLNNLTLAIREVIACFPVYRTYTSPTDTKVSERDRQYIHIAVEKAKRRTPALSPDVYDFLKEVLLLNLDVKTIGTEELGQYRDFILRFQQLTGPVMAKGLEDTVFYVYNRFIALNEVAGDPVHFGLSRSEFHRQNKEKNKKWPMSFLASSTHDAKRSEDVRMRLAVLSEMPDEWKTHVTRWARANEKHKTLIGEVPYPDRNTEYFIYQTLAGVWPHSGVACEDAGVFLERMWTYFVKAIREAKTHTNWVNPDSDFENAVRRFLEAILSQEGENQFLKGFLGFQKKISVMGMLNSLSSTVLKIASCGVVDIYQGTENWSFCLVDPDNRRSVDYDGAAAQLGVIKDMVASGRPLDLIVREFMSQYESGLIKQYVYWRGLNFRKSNPKLFLGAEYIPLVIKGERKNNAISFMRKHKGQLALVTVTRFYSGLSTRPGEVFDPEDPLAPSVWMDTRVLLPKDFRRSDLKDILTGRTLKVRSSKEGLALMASDLFQDLNVSFLTHKDEPGA